MRRLRGELAGDGSGRHENPIPRTKRLKQDDDEDAPTYVLEDTNQSMTKAEYEAMMAGNSEVDRNAEKDDENTKHPLPTAQVKDTIVEVGQTTKKRKVAKVIGEEKEDEETDSKLPEKKVAKKTKKKGKPVKLSFGDEE